MSGPKWINPRDINDLWHAWDNVKPGKKPSSSEDVTPSPCKKHVSPKERYLERQEWLQKHHERQEWLQKHHETAMERNLKRKQCSPSPSPPRDVQNLLKKPVEGLGSGKGWENVTKKVDDIKRQYRNNKDYGKGLGFGPGDDSNNELEDEVEYSDEDYDMEDCGNPFRPGTNHEEYKAYARKLRKRRMDKRKGKKENYPAMAMRMRKKQQELRRKELAEKKRLEAEKKRLEESIFNLQMAQKLNNKRMHDMKKILKDIEKDMKKIRPGSAMPIPKKKKPPKKTKTWYMDDSEEETESDLQHKINIKF